MSINFNDIILFEGKTFDTLLKDIYTKSQKKSKDFDGVMTKIIELATTNPSQAANLMPLLTEYAEASIKNDDMLIKLANIVRGFYSKSLNSKESEESDWNMPQHEIDNLLESMNKIETVEILDLPIIEEENK